jgi:hypothetical protein
MTQLKLSELKNEYEKAVKEGKDKFSIKLEDDTFEFLTSYAKGMIEHLDKVFEQRGLDDNQTFELKRTGNWVLFG